jgi:hypothetical protein
MNLIHSWSQKSRMFLYTNLVGELVFFLLLSSSTRIVLVLLDFLPIYFFLTSSLLRIFQLHGMHRIHIKNLNGNHSHLNGRCNG